MRALRGFLREPLRAAAFASAARRVLAAKARASSAFIFASFAAISAFASATALSSAALAFASSAFARASWAARLPASMVAAQRLDPQRALGKGGARGRGAGGPGSGVFLLPRFFSSFSRRFRSRSRSFSRFFSACASGLGFISSGSPLVGLTHLPELAVAVAFSRAALAFALFDVAICSVLSLSSASEVTSSVSITSSLSFMLLSNSFCKSPSIPFTRPRPPPRASSLGALFFPIANVSPLGSATPLRSLPSRADRDRARREGGGRGARTRRLRR